MAASLVVIKYGGHAMEDPDLGAAFAESLVSMAESGTKFVLVHGGGPQINSLLKRLDIKSDFVDGLRVTDKAALEVAEMVLCGQVNKGLTRFFAGHGLKAAGISGQDGGILRAERERPELGFVGRVSKVNPELIQVLLNSGYLPVVAPLALGPEGTCLNVNADTAAGAVAGALHADYFVLVSDVPGVLDENKQLIPHLDRAGIDTLLDRGVINGGMIPKVKSCLHAIGAGCRGALILDGRAKSSLQRCLSGGEPLGTAIEN